MQATIRQPAGCITAAGMRTLESRAMANGCDEPMLMEIAGTRLGHAVGKFFPLPGTAVAWPGKGHNGGDALIALRVLRDDYGWQIRIRHLFPPDAFASLTRLQFDSHLDTPAFDPGDPSLRHPLIQLDGLLGIGADGSPLRGPLAGAAAEMNHQRNAHGALTIAVDLPSGMHPDTGAFPENAVLADATFTLGAVKSGLVQPAAANAVGSITLVAIPQLTAPPAPGPRLVCPQHQRTAAAPRPHDFHKGMAGRVAILAGCEHYLGAAVLCGSGALAGGAGLVTLHVPRAIHAVIASKCAPELIVMPFDHPADLTDLAADAWVIGCGLGSDWGDDLIHFLRALPEVPTVLDADALNAVARADAVAELCAHHLITPHPGEFRRLAPELAALPPLAAADAWTRISPATLLLKGCRSVVASGEEALLVNSTGHPGMATAGQGDVLAGVAGALLATKIPLPEAAALAAWLCGRAAERAVHHQGESAESLRASSVIANLGPAITDWRRLDR